MGKFWLLVEKEMAIAYDLTDALNVSTGQWHSLAPLNTGRHGTQAIVSGNGIHITSGSPNQGGGKYA